MKKLEELGISPAPWNIKYTEIPAEYGGGRFVNGIVSRNGGALIDRNMGIADARLTAAAPKMYKGLMEAVIEMCGCCPSCGGYPDYACNDKGKGCFVKQWRKALAEASGEGVK